MTKHHWKKERDLFVERSRQCVMIKLDGMIHISRVETFGKGKLMPSRFTTKKGRCYEYFEQHNGIHFYKEIEE